MGADLSLWNTQPSGAMNYAGPGVANLNGTSVVAFNDSGSGAGANGPTTSVAGNNPFAQWWNNLFNNPQSPLSPQAQGCVNGMGDPADCSSAGLGTGPSAGRFDPSQAASQALTKTVSDILGNKSLWLLAGMILLFVIVVMVIRR